jgi:hypothetical protein
MAVHWRVTYSIKPNIEVAPADTVVPALSLELVYSDGKLSGAVHTVEAEADPATAFTASGAQLRAFWEALRYISRIPLAVKAWGAETPGHVARRSTVAMNSVLRFACRLPDPGHLQKAPTRLPVWLWLANTAHSDSDDAEALANYYIILEEIHGEPSQWHPALQGIAFARNFVSHGQIDRPKGRAFLQNELGYPAAKYQYDPHDRAHRKLVNKYRGKARQAVEKELQPYI